VKEVLAITNGNIHRVFDAAATGDEFAKALFKELPEPKYFSTTNDWLVSSVEYIYSRFTDIDLQDQHHRF
jgi:hypothetical protein